MADVDAAPKIISRKDAKVAGIKHFCTGKPCKYGHLAPRYTSTGICLECSNARWSCRQFLIARDAKSTSGTTYFTGKPCTKGHVAPRYVSSRGCVVCANKKKKEWARNNRSHVHAYSQANAWKRDPEKFSAYKRNRKARQKAAVGSHTGDDVRDIFRLQRGRCALCGEKLGKKYHVDHIVALARGGTNDRSNIQIAHPRCNVSKNARDQIDFMREERGLLL